MPECTMAKPYRCQQEPEIGANYRPAAPPGRGVRRFARVETGRTAAEFVTGLLADVEVETSWQLADLSLEFQP
jgi:hypothetical protein